MQAKGTDRLKVVCISNDAFIPNQNVDGSKAVSQTLIDLVLGKIYIVLQERDGWYQLVDEFRRGLLVSRQHV